MGGAKSRRRALAAVVGVELQLRQPRRPSGKVLELCLGRRRGREAESVILYDGWYGDGVVGMCCGWIEYIHTWKRRVSRLREGR